MLDTHAAARAERQARDVLALHEKIRDVVRLLLGRHGDVADREPRDTRRRVRVTLDQHG